MIDLRAIQQEFDNDVLTCAEALVKQLDPSTKKMGKHWGACSVVVLDACDCDMRLPSEAIRKAESMIDDDEEILESWKLNSCRSKKKIIDVLEHAFAYGSGENRKNVVLYHENYKIRQLLDDHFSNLPVVRCPEMKLATCPV